MKNYMAILAALVMLGGCSAPALHPAVPEESPSQTQSSSAVVEVSLSPSQPDPIQESSAPSTAPQVVGTSCAADAADALLARLIHPGMTDIEQIGAVYEYLVATTYFDEDNPIGLNIWRVRPGADTQPGYVENRALSVLLYQLGSCEDYAAALTVLLQRLGFEARYVPGLTISIYGGFVDHAWTAVELDGVWYHLDAQLEDNVMKDNTLTYRYFLRSDSSMYVDHRWGQNLIDSAWLTAAQNAAIRADYLLPACPQNAPLLPHKQLDAAAPPNRAAIQGEINKEIDAWQSLYGPLPPLRLDIIPPVFGELGYGD